MQPLKAQTQAQGKSPLPALSPSPSHEEAEDSRSSNHKVTPTRRGKNLAARYRAAQEDADGGGGGGGGGGGVVLSGAFVLSGIDTDEVTPAVRQHMADALLATLSGLALEQLPEPLLAGKHVVIKSVKGTKSGNQHVAYVLLLDMYAHEQTRVFVNARLPTPPPAS